jgi:PAS domain S-box-containing protein
MAPSKGESNELKRFLLASEEAATVDWLAGLRSSTELRKGFPRRISDDRHMDTLAGIFHSLVNPISLPTKSGKTRAIRLKKSQRQYLEGFPLHNIQQALLILLDILNSLVEIKFSENPKKAQRLSAGLTRGIQGVLLGAARADARRLESAEARARGKYAGLLDMATDAVFLPDYETGLFLEVNEAACRLTGYSQAELKTMGFSSLVSVFDLNLTIEKTGAALENGAVRFDGVSIYTKSGAEIPVDISLSVALINGEKHIISIVRDIKERKALEKKLREEAGRLKLVNQIGSAISSADMDIEAVLTRILEAIARVVKVEAGSILRLDGEELVFMVALGEKAEQVKPFKIKLGQGIAGWVAKTGEELVIRDAQNDPRYFSGIEKATGFVSHSILAVPMKSNDRVVGVIELLNKSGGHFTRKDASLISAVASFSAAALEHARLFTQCELANQSLAETRSALSSARLAAAVAHEVKDPLGILKNYVRILFDRGPGSQSLEEELSIISDETDRIAGIVDQLLNFSEASAEEAKETPLNLMIENSVESMADRLASADITTELRLARTVPRISAIPNQLKMVFMNLLRLSLAEMPNGGSIEVVTQKRGSNICINFSNTGKKHSRAEADELFLPSAVAKGLVPKGVGLYMVHKIISELGGTIEVRPRKGGGTVFRVTLPIKLKRPEHQGQGGNISE